MKTITPPTRRALAVLVPTLLVLAAPAAAQVQTTTTPPPPVSVAPPPVVPTVRAAPTPPAPTVQSLPAPDVTPEAEATPAPARTATVKRAAPARAASPARAPVARTAPARTATAAPAAPAPAAPASETPVAQAPAPVAAPVADTVPATQPAPGAIADTTQTTTESAPVWPWIVAGIVGLLAIIGLVALSRRRKARVEEVYEEPVAYAEPVAEPAPLPVADPMVAAPIVAVAPVVSEEPKFLRPEPAAAEAALPLEDGLSTAPDSAELVSADAAEVDALTAGDPPVADRPWLEMAMRPVRAGTSAEDALVEIELTVGNAGSVAAKDVRISTFMFAGEPASGEMERMLTEHNPDAVPSVTIEPGEGTTLEATLALSRDALDGEVSPLIFADARYPLPGGGEGHTSAAFRIGISQEDGSITPIQIGKPHMTQTVDAELYGTPERV